MTVALPSFIETQLRNTMVRITTSTSICLLTLQSSSGLAVITPQPGSTARLDSPPQLVRHFYRSPRQIFISLRSLSVTSIVRPVRYSYRYGACQSILSFAPSDIHIVTELVSQFYRLPRQIFVSLLSFFRFPYQRSSVASHVLVHPARRPLVDHLDLAGGQLGWTARSILVPGHQRAIASRSPRCSSGELLRCPGLTAVPTAAGRLTPAKAGLEGQGHGNGPVKPPIPK